VTLPLDTIVCGDNVEVMAGFPDECIDLVVTSPPYDNLRLYDGFSWDFEALARELWRVIKPGGVVVWVVGDATVNGSETGTSFKQALYFKGLGFRLYDTMIYRMKNILPRQNGHRYEQAFEYMFVLSKGRPEVTNIKQVPCIRAGEEMYVSARDNGQDALIRRWNKTADYKSDINIWEYGVGKGGSTNDNVFSHPAIFPEKLAHDHIISWSNPGQVVLDPFCGSGTTAKMCVLTDRKYIGIDVSQSYVDLSNRRVAAVKAQPRLFTWDLQPA
jgi:site-specific DNA-methyltransferase (adenine-specific)